MTTFMITLLFTFLLLTGAAFCINFCKSRARNTKHQLTGMCHQSGGAACCGADDLQQNCSSKTS